MIQIGRLAEIEEYCPNWESLNTEWTTKFPINPMKFWNQLRYTNSRHSHYWDITGSPISPNANAVVMVCQHCGADLFYPYLTIWDDWSSGMRVPDDAIVYFGDNSDAYLKAEIDAARHELQDIVQRVRQDSKKATDYQTEGACPICGAKGNFYSKSIKLGRVDNYYNGSALKQLTESFSVLHEDIIRKKKADGIREGKVEGPRYLSQMERQVEEIEIGGDKIQDVEQIKNYLLSVIQIEGSIYACRQRIMELVSLSYKTEPVVHCFNREDYVSGNIKYIQQIIDSLADEKVLTDQAFLYGLTIPQKPIKPVEPVYKKPGFMNRKKIEQENEEARKLYQDQIASYHQSLKNCEDTYKTVSEEIRTRLCQDLEVLQTSSEDLISSQGQQELDLINSELETAKEMYNRLLLTRAQLYGRGVIYHKYRDIVSVSTIYEYFMSGRCEQLEGPQGAYNLLESELRANAIISKLDTVIEKLDDIQQGQYTLYKEMKKINTNLSDLSSSMDEALVSLRHIRDTNISIAYNTQKTAFYARMTSAIVAADFFLK